MSNKERLNNKTTEELVAICQDAQHADKNDALYVLIVRFRKDLLEKSEIVCEKFGHGPAVAEIITENTFKAYARKGKFNVAEGTGDTIDDSFALYLYGIARNELVNYHRQQEKKRRGFNYDGNEVLHHDLPKVHINDNNAEAKFRYDTIQALAPPQRTVYLTYLVYQKAGFNLPKKLQRELRIHLGNVKQSTIRSYKKDATDKVEEALRAFRLSQKLLK